MKKILLTQGKIALVDDEDYDLVNNYKWYARKHRNTWYAYHKNYKHGIKTWTMHRFIMEHHISNNNWLQIDHINCNGLDNRLRNMRYVTDKQNCQNRYKSWGISKYKGVNWNKCNKKWRARILSDGRRISLGCFYSENLAAVAYNIAALYYFGKYAHLNEIKE